jgi:hypothetical protein
MRRWIKTIAVLGAIAVLAVVALASTVTQAATPSCLKTIAGTYYRPGDYVITLVSDHSLTGQYSQSTQDAFGLEESFSGRWTCSGNNVTLQQFDFLGGGTPHVERGNATGTFDGNLTLTLTYTFHEFAESASAASLRNGTGSVTNVPTLQVVRVSKP